MTISKHIQKSQRSLIAEATKEYLAANVGSFRDIAKGAGVSVEWLYKLHRNHKKNGISNPSALYCERVLLYSGYKIEIHPPKED